MAAATAGDAMSEQGNSAASLLAGHPLRQYWDADHGRLLHAIKAALAVILVVWISMRFELVSPRTAMVTTVILMMHQHAGMVIARGFYRGFGMAVGSLVGLLLVACLPQQPLPFIFILSVWIGLCVWGAAYHRGYQSYGFVLSGYATAITAVPAWINPYGVFDSVVFTLSEVAAGIVCAGLVSALILPQYVSDTLFTAGQNHFHDFMDFVRRMSRGDLSRTDMDVLHLKLIGGLAQIDDLRSAAVFEKPELRLHSRRLANQSQDFLAAGAGFYAMRQARKRAVRLGDDHVLALIDRLYGHLYRALPDKREGAAISATEANAFLDRLQTINNRLPRYIETESAELDGASEQARQLHATAAAALQWAVADLGVYVRGFIALRWEVSARMPSAADGVRTRDLRIASTANRMAAGASGLRATIAVSVVAALWIATGWTGGSTAVIAVSITSALFAIAPQPDVATRQLFLGCLLGWVAAFAFNFFLMPRLDGYALLAICLAPVIMTGSYINTFPRTAVIGLGFNINFCFILNVTNPAVFEPATLLDVGFGMLIGIAVSALAFSVVVPHSSAWATAQYVRQLRRDVSQTACHGPEEGMLPQFESRVRDFVVQIAAHPATDRAGRQYLLGWAYAALEIGRAMIRLRADSRRLEGNHPDGWRAQQLEWQTAIAELFEHVTPAHHAKALQATRRATALLPAPVRIESGSSGYYYFRMRALLHFTELTLLDETLPIRPVAEADS